jgi:hypothetical protein
MENLVEKLQSIVEDFKKNENLTHEEFAALKNREFELFGNIETIKEVCEYYKTDMTLDKMDPQFISGFYSGVINGSMFVINKLADVLGDDWNDKDVANAIVSKIEVLQGVKEV